MAKTLKVGIIGVGGIARGAHIPGYKALDNVALVAGADIDAKARKAAREECGIPNVYDTYEEMLEKQPDLDLVSVCTGNRMHKDPTIAALKAGCHVLVEKPIAMNAQDGQAMVDAARKHKRRLMVGVNCRFDAKSQALKRLIDDGALGEVYAAKAIATRRRGIPSWGVFSQKAESGGGPLIDIGVHCLDLAMYLMGYPKPLAVSGSTYAKFGKNPPEDMIDWRWDPRKFSVEDYASAFVRLENRACLTLEASWASNIDHDVFNVEIMGDKGGCTWNPCKMYSSRAGVLINLEPVRMPEVRSHSEEIRRYVDAILNDKETPAPAEQVLETQRILDGIYASSEQNREVWLRKPPAAGRKAK